MRRYAEFLGLRRGIIGLLAMVVLVGMGERLAERFLPIYLLAMGGGAVAIGLFNGLNVLLGALYSLPGGYLTHRLGTRRALVLFNLMAMAGYAVVIAVPAWQAVLLGCVLFLSWSAISLPATMNLIALVLPANKRTMGISIHSLVRRVPMALGPVIGGLFIDHWGERDGVRLAFVAAMIMAGMAIVLQMLFITREQAQEQTDASAPLAWHPLACLRRMSPALRQLLVSDILIRFCEQIPYAFVVIWCMKLIADPVGAAEFGLLTAIEMATAVLVYVPVAAWADRTAKKPFVIATFVFFSIFPLVLMVCHSFWPLVGAFIIRGLKEFGEPTRKSMILELAPPDARALTFGAYYLVRDSVVSVAALMGGLLWQTSPTLNLLTAASCGLIGTVWFARYGKDPNPER